jgi:hypothetical protein
MPVAVIGTRYSAGYRLPDAGYAIPVGVVVGVAALLLARSARQRNDRALGRLGGESAVRWGRAFGAFGIWLALTALVALGVYLFLKSRA